MLIPLYSNKSFNFNLNGMSYSTYEYRIKGFYYFNKKFYNNYKKITVVGTGYVEIDSFCINKSKLTWKKISIIKNYKLKVSTEEVKSLSLSSVGPLNTGIFS